MLRKLLAMACFVLSIAGANSAHAQSFATVVTTCGTVSPQFHVGDRPTLTMDINGKLCDTGGSGGGLAVTDETSWTAGSSQFTPTGGVFNDSATALTSGQEGSVRLTAQRAMHIDVDSTNNQLHTDLTSAPTLGSASGGTSVKTLAALSNTAVAVKASAGQVFRVQCYNPDASAKAYIQIFNVAAASVTMGSTAPNDFIGVAAGTSAGFTRNLVGDQYSTAISAGAASTATGGTAPTTALDCTVSYN